MADNAFYLPDNLHISVFRVAGLVAPQWWGVSYNPKYICALKGSTVTIECTYTYPRGQSVIKAFWSKYWIRGAEPPNLLADPEYRGRVQYLGDKYRYCSLRLSDVREKDRSKYYFTIITRTSAGRYQGEGGVDLSVTGKIHHPSGEIVEGRSVTLTCSSDGNPPVEYNWFKGISLVGKEKTYTMKKISSVDSGEYKCRSSNEHGEKLSEALTLNVLCEYILCILMIRSLTAVLQFLDLQKNVSVSISPSGEIVEGSSVTLTCNSDANPPVQNYTWFKGPSLVAEGETYTMKEISSVDSGEYKCRSSNKHGEKLSEALTLNVSCKCIFISTSNASVIVAVLFFSLICTECLLNYCIYLFRKQMRGVQLSRAGFSPFVSEVFFKSWK
uniref:Ig-like domain-containing protein n=1 Tax=Pygocentrus nattereri TaxID=42514 RepID=A0A3B4EKT3_PYGNA